MYKNILYFPFPILPEILPNSCPFKKYDNEWAYFKADTWVNYDKTTVAVWVDRYQSEYFAKCQRMKKIWKKEDEK